MLRFNKILVISATWAIAALVAQPPAHAQLQARLIASTPDGHVVVTIQGHHGTLTTHRPIQIGNFTVFHLTGTSSGKAADQTARMELSATVTGGAGQTLLIQLTDTGFLQTGEHIFTESVTGDITVAGSVTFQAFKDFTNTPFGMPEPPAGASPGLLGPFYPDAFSQAMSTPVMDNAPYSMTLDATVMGGDVNFDFVATNGPPPPIP